MAYFLHRTDQVYLDLYLITLCCRLADHGHKLRPIKST